MNFIQNLFEDIINHNVSSSSRILVHVAFIASFIAEIFFFFTVETGAYHFVILGVLTIGAYISICWVLHQLDTNPELQEAMRKAREEQSSSDETTQHKEEEEEKEEKKEEHQQQIEKNIEKEKKIKNN